MKQLYYVISVEDTKKENTDLYFTTEEPKQVVGVSNNLNNAWVSNVYSDKEADLIYIEKEKIDRFAHSNIEKARFVENNQTHRRELGLKYKNDTLQRATGVGVEEDYILLLDRAEESRLSLPFFSDNGGMTSNLRQASIEEAPYNANPIYIKKSILENLATPFPDGSIVVLNGISNLKALGLEYRGGVLFAIEKEALHKTKISEQ